MNTYRVGGTYRMWNNPELSFEPFSRIVLASKIEDAIQLCKEVYREAVIISTVLRDEDVLTEPPGGSSEPG
jgi:hypothetical protein